MIKKIAYLLITILFLIPIGVKAGNMDSFTSYVVDDSIYVHRIIKGEYKKVKAVYHSIEGKTAYCVEPGVKVENNTYYNSTTDNNLVGISTDLRNKISLIGYYGYDYKNHNTKEYYLAAQELIWRLTGSDDVWWIDSKTNETLNLESYKNEIMNLVNSYEVSPSFEFKDDYIIGDKITLEDKNNVLSDYEVDSGDVTILDNNIIVNVLEDNKFSLKRKNDINGITFYYKNGYQTMATFESRYEYKKEYNLKGIYSSVIINKLDYDTKSKNTINGVSLQGSEYSIYDSSMNMLDTKETDSDGMIEFNRLKKGKYYIKENKPSLGYTLDNNTYEVTIDDNKLVTIDVYEKLIYGNLKIKKVLDEGLIPEKNITFGIYKDDELYGSYTTDYNGIINVSLPYGTYVIKQLNANGTDFAKDEVIQITNEEEKELLIVNHSLPKQLPQTGKNSISIISIILFLIIMVFYEK